MQILDPELLREFARSNRCEWCGSKTPRGCQPHHFWYRRGMGGGSQLDVRLNLIALCLYCHDDAHWGRIKKRDFMDKVAKREGVLPADAEQTLLRWRKA